MIEADLLFNIDLAHELVTEAIITLAEPVDAAWPLDDINSALAECYEASLDLPAIWKTWDNEGTYGYVIGNGRQQWSVAYRTPYGPDLPIEPINDAIHRLMGQTLWPDDRAIYLYPVRKGESPEMSGLWLADTLDNVGDDPELDDVAFRMVRDASRDKHALRQFPQFQPRRYTI